MNPFQMQVFLVPGGMLPVRKHEAGSYDIPTRAIVSPSFDGGHPYMRETVVSLDTAEAYGFLLLPGRQVYIGTGIVLKLPDGTAGYLKPRSSTVEAGIAVLLRIAAENRSLSAKADASCRWSCTR
jgi:deoxycytidine triphosphate deaminase